MKNKTLWLMRMRKNEEVRVREKKGKKNIRNKMRKEEDEENGSIEKRK